MRENNVSIPQAVSTVATQIMFVLKDQFGYSFNTASGKHCCNFQISPEEKYSSAVSIPQAVSTVATAGSRKPVFMRFQKLVLENLKP